MTNTIEPYYHKQLLYLQSKVSDDILRQVKKETEYILENENSAERTSSQPHRVIPFVMSMSEMGKEILKPNLIALANEYYKRTKRNQDYPHWDFRRTWINFQKKHEQFSLHDHNGDLSFVMWVQIPYDLQEELKPPPHNSKILFPPSSSLFNFVYTDTYGTVITKQINVDKSYEGTIIMFQSNLKHLVYPFHTSDDYRISISGNLNVGAPQTPPKINAFSYNG